MDRPNNSESVEIGGTWPLKLRGLPAILIGLIVLLLAFIAWLMNFSLSQWGVPIDLGKTLQGHIEEQSAQHQSIKESAEESTFIQACALQSITKRSMECEEVARKLTMPASLRKRLRTD